MFIAAGFAVSFAAWDNANAAAIAIELTDPTPHYVDTIDKCIGLDGTRYHGCTSTASINTTSALAANDGEFRKAFDVWNGTNAANAKWTLDDTVKNLPGGKLQVSTFDALAYFTVGGLEIQIDWTYNGADKADYKWTQGLYDNYFPAQNIIVDPPVYEMDVNAAEANKPPLYPFQYDERFFYDKPLGFWPGAFFIAEAFLSKADYTTRTLSLYEGVSYEFHLDVQSVPEPSSLLLLMAGAAGLCVSRRIQPGLLGWRG